MPRTTRRQVLALGASATTLALLGAQKPLSGLAGRKDPAPKADETVGDLAFVRTAGEARVEGIGLVAGLDGTGSIPEPGPYTEKLLAGMRAAQVEKPDQLLATKDFSLVLVRGSIPVGIDKEDRFDVAVELPPNSTTTSLAGGVLLRTDLRPVGFAGGQMLEGQVMGWAGGPIVTGTTEKPDELRAGRILGGARARQDQPFLITIREGRRSARTAALLERVIATRFFVHDGPEQKGMASAKSDQLLTLKVPKVYHQNQARFFQIVQLLPIVSTPELGGERLERWGRDLLEAKTAGVAALRLEGYGPNAVPTLKTGLASTDPTVRYFAAEALAYLGDAGGATVLAEACATRPEFRAHALAALAASDQQAALAKLRGLLAHPDPELRYGAFNALRTADPYDGALGRLSVLRAEPVELPEDRQDDPMAFQIARARAMKRQPPEPFELYAVPCDGPPGVHVSNHHRCEIVLFGGSQKLLTPAVLGEPSAVLVNAGPDDREVQLARIGGPDAPDRRTTCAPFLAEIIREAANLGATYPQVVGLLQSADRRKNLEGPLFVDVAPAPGASYDAAQLASAPGGRPQDDAAVERAGASRTSKEPRRGLFGRLRGNADRRPR